MNLVKKMNKRKQENFRTDPVTALLLDAVKQKQGDDKSKIIRAAIHYFANHVLGEEEVKNILLQNYFKKGE